MATVPWVDELAHRLTDANAKGRRRQTHVRSGAQGVRIVLDSRSYLSFCSNDYLGLASHPDITQAFIDAAKVSGVGSGAAHLLTGHSDHHHALEQSLAEFVGSEKVLLFSSGYAANMGVIDALMQRGDAIIEDKLNHASLLDGARMSDADLLRYPHGDMARLHHRLHNAAAKRKMIVTDSLFSMDGDMANLPDIMALAIEHRAAVLVDDAHGIGVLGAQGAGSVSHWDLPASHRPIVMGTFGKAFGTAGAFIAADAVVIDTLIQQARTFIYTTAQPAAVAAATCASLKLVQTEDWRRDKLHSLIEQFRTGAAVAGLNLMPSDTPIQPILIGDEKSALAIGETLQASGILVGVIRPPTVPEGSARLRVTLSAAHEPADIDQLLVALAVACD